MLEDGSKAAEDLALDAQRRVGRLHERDVDCRLVLAEQERQLPNGDRNVIGVQWAQPTHDTAGCDRRVVPDTEFENARELVLKCLEPIIPHMTIPRTAQLLPD